MRNPTIILQLVLSVTPLLTTYVYTSSDAVIPDYDDVNDMFYGAEEKRQKRSLAGIGLGSGSSAAENACVMDSGSGTLIPGTDAPDVDLIENCTLPDSVCSNGEEETTSRFRGICHSLCLQELDTTLANSTKQMLLGYPLWPQNFLSYKFSEDGIRGVDCLLPLNPNRCRIPDTCPAALDQNRDVCNSGCKYGFNYLLRNLEYPPDFRGVTFQPTGPPAVNHIFGTRYSVNISTAIPVVRPPYDTLVNFGFTTTIIRVDGQAATRFYVLDRSTEVNLEYFACQTVNVTFQVASARRGFSNFSLPLEMDVINLEVYDREYPDQLNASSVRGNVSEDERVGFFHYHIIEISWELPNNHQFAEYYFLSMKSSTDCGLVSAFINDTNVTSHTFQVTSAERDSGIPVPPITACCYDLESPNSSDLWSLQPKLRYLSAPQQKASAGGGEGSSSLQSLERDAAPNPLEKIEVFPRNFLRQDELFSGIINTGPYAIPISEDLMLNCSSVVNVTENYYDITLKVRYAPVFTPAVFSAISFINISRFEFDENDHVVPNGNGMSNLLEHIDDATLQSSLNFPLSPLSLRHSYKFFFVVHWKSDFPRSANLPRIEASCVIIPTPLDPIAQKDITIISQELTALNEEIFKVDIEFNFTFVHPGDRLMQMGFEIWFSEFLAPENTGNLQVGTQKLGPLENSGTESRLLKRPSDSTNLYFQIRPFTQDAITDWSTPLVLIFTLDSTRPKTVTEESFNITAFTYSTSRGGMHDVIVAVAMEIEHNIKSDISSASFELWFGTEQLPADQADVNQDNVREFHADSCSSQSIQRSLALPALGVFLYLQIRAVNMANLPGNWSSPEVINVEKIPPPMVAVGPTLSNVIPTRNNNSELTLFRFTLELDLFTDDPAKLTDMLTTHPNTERRRKREAVRVSGMVVTHFGIAIGFKAVEDPYGEVPSSSVEDLVAVGEGPVQVTKEIVVDDNNSSLNITLLLQMRSLAGEAYGMWSKPLSIPVPIELVAMEPTESTLSLTTESSFPPIIGVAILVAIIAAILLTLIVAISIFFCYKKYKFRDSSFKSGVGDNGGMKLWIDDADTHCIPVGMVKGKELVVDCWEIPTMKVIVEDHLQEGAFGVVFKGTIRGPLRNPKLSAKLKNATRLPIAIKLLKETATGKERSDFLVEIDMMKKISEGHCNNIVNMVGCVTLQEPFCLLTEFVSHGDLLQYLISQRKKNSSRQREEKHLRRQLEQQRKAYEVIKRKMVMLQFGRAESSGYIDSSDINCPQSCGIDGDMTDEQQQEQQQQLSIPSPQGSAEGHKDDSFQFTNITFGEVTDEKKSEEMKERAIAAYPCMEGMNEYSHYDPLPTDKQEEATVEEKDIYADLGDLNANNLMQFAYQIATGMEYLSSINIVHRDLACRNVLVGEGKNLKITDFGLSREVEDVYVKTTIGRLPLKWMALESIETREFTTQSDVWSYGVTLWEIGTLGGFPYPTIQNQDLLMQIKQGYRLEKPENCAAEVYSIMLECWQEHPIDRPTFIELRNKFSDLLLASTSDSYMVLQIDESKMYYTVGEVEEKNCRESELSSTDSIKKAKNKVFEKPRWAQDANAYAPMSSTSKEEHTHIEDEHYRPKSASGTIGLKEKQSHSSMVVAADVIAGPNGNVESISNGRLEEVPNVVASSHLPLKQSISLPALKRIPVSLDDQVGIPLSFVMGSSVLTGEDALHNGRGAKKSKSNYYVDDPRTRISLEVIEEDMMLLEGVPAQESKIGTLMTELNSKCKVVRSGDDEDVTIM